MALIIWIIRPETIIMVILSIIIGIIVYFGTLILMRGFSKFEWEFFISFLKEIKNSIFSVKELKS